MYIVTGKTGTPHVTGADDAAFNAGVVGSGDYVLSNRTFTAEQVAPGRIQLGKAEILMGGVHGRIEGTEVLTINAAAQGKKRIDIIAARYEVESGGIQSITPVVIQGAPADSNPVAPTLDNGSIYDGANTHEMALVRVTVDAATPTKIEVVAVSAPSIGGFNKLSSDITALASRVSTAEASIKTNASAINTNKTNITTVTNKANANATNITNLQNATKDSGWANMPPQNGWSVNGSLTVRKVGSLVEINGQVKPPSGYNGTSDVIVAVIPSGYRPSKGFAYHVTGTDESWGRARVSEGGNVYLDFMMTKSGAYDTSVPAVNLFVTYML